jgi:hypothetical protein
MYPSVLTSEAVLDEVLSSPSPALVDFFRQLPGDLLILGIAGKMGGTLGRLAVRAAQAAGAATRVWGASRFSDPAARARLEEWGIATLPCDLLDPAAVARLPRVPNVLYLAGRKFGTQGLEALTWALNVVAPANVGRHFVGSRLVAFSTGCVYPLVPWQSGGCTEDTPPAPVGEYAQSCLGRERIFEYYGRTTDTPVCHLRLNYAVELRYGVLHDLAWRIWRGEPVDLSASHVNVIWQGDACEIALRALDWCAVPAAPLNLTGPELLAVRDLAEGLGARLGRAVRYSGTTSAGAYLNNATQALTRFGPPRVTVEQLLDWMAAWVHGGGVSFGKPTHFEVTTGVF